ncbi:SRPBCC domain-containing protein [Nitrososphaera viennensis]|uniref:Activator of Hsp90 ATPase homologue 1/2-like C-terminal domain-containing protein n=2 Tax=Nitrososphaera viennensis TaxID=1034015 RepID=A0A060HLI6_9ARCH|nr:SRPBCC domain-containing protein [Nitrososphaera viennensis]AIC16090.1 hypothetical protein NVIE_018350 [Nitrososphaera viennensis EN76]UVS68057.1 SRPBCC domain-containing protein [Nitrososphaera viennensis]
MTETIEKSIVINAPQAAVFKALTSENDLTHWFPNQVKLEPRAGGAVEFRFLRADGTVDHRVVGKVLEIIPDRKFSMSWKNTSDPDFPDTTVTWTLEPAAGGKTLVTVVHTGLKGKWAKDVNEGWSYFTVQLADYCKNSTKEIRKTIVIDAPHELVFSM